MNKTLRRVIFAILVLNLIILVYLTSFKLNAFNESFYKKEFEKYDVYGKFPEQDIDKINSGLLLYLKGRSDSYNKELFNQREISHLEDVKILMGKIDIFYYFILIISILLMVLLFLLDRKRFLKYLSSLSLYSGLVIFVFSLVLFILIVFNFDNVFTLFHRMFFVGGSWIFSSSDSLVNIYPSGFFYDIAKIIFFHGFLYGNILIVLGFLVYLYRK